MGSVFAGRMILEATLLSVKQFYIIRNHIISDNEICCSIIKFNIKYRNIV